MPVSHRDLAPVSRVAKVEKVQVRLRLWFVVSTGWFFVPIVKIRLFVGEDGLCELVEVVVTACSEFQCIAPFGGWFMCS